MQQPESPTSTLLATPHSQSQDLPSNLSLPSPSPPPASTVGRRAKLSKPGHPIKSLRIKPATPASDQVTISPLHPTQDPFMDRKDKQALVQSVRIDVGAGKPVRRFTLPKMFMRSSTKQFDPYLPPPPREPSDGSTRGCSEDSTAYPRLKSSSLPQSKSKRHTTAIAASVPHDASRVDQPPQQVAPVASAAASPSDGTSEPRPDGIQVTLKTSPSTDVPLPTSSQERSCADEPTHPSSSSRPQPVHQESSGSQVPESLYPQGPPQPAKTSTSRSRLLVKQRAMTDSSVGAATSRRERRRWTKFWKALLKKLGFKSSAPSTTATATPSPRKLKSKSKAPSDPDVGSVVETLPADSDEADGDAVGLNLSNKARSTGTPSPPLTATRSRSNSPYMERTTTAVEPHNIPLPGGESSLSLVITEPGAEQEDDLEEEENPETPLHAHTHSHTHSQSLSLSSPINASSTSFTTTSSPLSVPSFLAPDRSATTITLPTTVDHNSTCLDLSIEEEGSGGAAFGSSDRGEDDEDDQDTLTVDEQDEEAEEGDEEESTPTPTPCPPAVVGPMADPSASTSTLQLATITAIPDDDNSEFAFDDEEEEGDRKPPSTPRLPSASHPNQTAPQLTTSVPHSTAPSPPIATRPDLKRSASTSNVVPPAAPSTSAAPKARTGPSKFLFVKHSRWRGNSTLGHELGIRMFEEQYPTIETSLFFDSRAQRTWLPLPPPPRQTHDDDGDSIIDVVEDDDDEEYDGGGYSDFEDEPVGGWKEYFEEDDYYYQHDEEEADGDVSTELGHHGAPRGGKVNAHAQEQSEDLADMAFCAASSNGSFVSSTEEVGRAH